MLHRKVVNLIGVALLVLVRQGVGATCEGDNITLPDRTIFTSVLKQAESGNTLAQAQIGMAYIGGDGSKQDISKGLYWLTKSANGGNIEGQYLLGRYYVLKGKNEKDFQRAAKWLRKTANKGCMQSLAYLGILSLAGKGGVKKDEQAGYEMMLKSAQSGYPLAQYTVGTLLITGDGVKKDTKAGFRWVKQAAAAGDSVAKIMLANLYLTGTGTKSDPEKTKTILLSIIEQGREQGPTAAYQLGWMYMEGKGVPVDKIRALELMISAAHSNVVDSKTRLNTLVQEVTKQKLVSTCNVYRDPDIGAKNAKEYLRAKPGETVIVLRQLKSSLKVFFPNQPLVGFISRSCFSTEK